MSQIINQTNSLDTYSEANKTNALPSSKTSQPDFFRSISSKIATSTLANSKIIPVGFIISPTIQNVPTIKQEGYFISHCFQCGAYLNWNCQINGSSFCCPICHSWSPLERGFNPVNNPMLSSIAYDIVTNEISNIKPPYVFAIDISLNSFLSGFTAKYIQSVIETLKSLPDTTYCSLITYSNLVTIYDGSSKTCITICESESEDFKKNGSQLIKSFVPLEESREFFIGVCQSIINSQRKYNDTLRIGNNYFNLLQTLEILFWQRGAIVFISLCAPTGFTQKGLIYQKNIQNDALRNISFHLNDSSIVINLFFATHGDDGVALLSIPSAFTGGSMFIYHFQNKTVFPEEGGNKIQKDLMEIAHIKYCLQCMANLKYPSDFVLSSQHGNFIVRQNGSALFAAMREGDSITYEMLTLQNRKFETASFQFIMRYVENGTSIIRVITQTYSSTSDERTLIDSIDNEVLEAFNLKKAANDILNTGKPSQNLKFHFCSSPFSKFVSLSVDDALSIIFRLRSGNVSKCIKIENECLKKIKT